MTGAVAATLAIPAAAGAHCDGLDGPVVKAAQQALATGEASHALIWVQAKDEPEIRKAFEETLAVRRLGPRAKDLADRFFFETLVRVHRAGEGAPYTGLQPAGRDLGPAIPAADKAIEAGSLAPVEALLTRTLQETLREHFAHVRSARTFEPGDVARGREYVNAYVEFIHFVERLYGAAAASAHGHVGAPAAAAGGHH
jgi:hypothetical protein